MVRLFKNSAIITIALLLFNCVPEDVRNIAGVKQEIVQPTAEIKPIDINIDGFDFLEKIQGHWIGPNRIIADDFDWFSFDFRPIAPSLVHSIFEGGTKGICSLLFVSEFKNTRTLMARNGGVLNGIYRTSYFVLDKIEENNSGKYFRFVDAKGGTSIMHMEFRFIKDSLYFNAYTSKLGISIPPTRHLTFKGKNSDMSLAKLAASKVGFPKNIVQFDFSNGFKEDLLYVNPGDANPKSATFLAQDDEGDVFKLAPISGDPYTIIDHPYLAYLQLNITRSEAIKTKSLFAYLSKKPLTNSAGYFNKKEAFDSVLQLPQLIPGDNQFQFTYLHPGTYYLTVVADMNGDSVAGVGDITSISKQITIAPLEKKQIDINDINIKN